MYYDIFNGDADGIFSLHQYRLHSPEPSTYLLTGVKRDTCLLSQLENLHNCCLTVFDVSLDSNRTSLLRLLQQDNKVTYFDHHFAGKPMNTSALQAHIDTDPAICTSLIVNRVLHDQLGLWAICGAFGDNLHEPATKLAKTFHLSEEQTGLLRQLGELFNYNSYGSTLDDLLFHPLDLYEAIKPYSDPFEYLVDSQHIGALQAAFQADIALAMQEQELGTQGINRVYHLPNRPWARRIVGVFSNLRARERTDAAHAIIIDNQDGTLRISVRAPLKDRRYANTLCNLYPTGGGRAAAAGINSLPKELLDQFINTFQSFYSRQ
ncbi:MAG: acetyltransferase [Proteobacteria bacterium]|nr:acetyltransferase [Pseudomonadota bacterium]